ncbi:crossover junction endodeoxyribonuclease RuvC [Actinoalloteichus hymeniacidonis]|uniref:Crossover junction endodeoxyribonuclease RuvC n=1 Tax=Actinoalloteichus hymeniacidonis TaxID=340345 RepID=A0AAC9HQ29_9PSEU|nr:Holliday junction endonuclease RuvC [Actinoalloteichus hymeniacidonis]MBB5909051.1 crossover junction endodeoxyribonuclease RuvC [Actinoalloteichus hymeniacidonis]
MRVLGVDPGLTRCGLGVVNGGVGRTISCVAVGVVRSPPEDELPDRLGQIADGVEQWLDEYRPDVVAIERVFSQHNVRSAMGTAQAGGVVALLAGRRGLPVRFHTPSEVKAAVTGSGRADKAQVTAMVTRLLRLDAPPKPADAADALALAICHLWRAPAADRLAGVKAESDRLAAAHRNRLSGARGKGSQSAPSSSERNGSSAPADHGVRATAPQAAPAAPQNGPTQGLPTGAPVSARRRPVPQTGRTLAARLRTATPGSTSQSSSPQQPTPSQPRSPQGGADRQVSATPRRSTTRDETTTKEVSG